MCTLTCGNYKYYKNENGEEKNLSKNRVKHFLDMLKEYFKDLYLYIKISNNFLENLFILLLFIPKIVKELASLFLLKFNLQFIKYFTSLIKLKFVNHSINQNKNSDKLHLPNVTLIAVATKNVEATLQALLYSCREIDFGKIKLLSHYTPFCKSSNIEFIRISKMKNIDEWSHFIIYQLCDYIETEFILLVHADGFVVNPNSWKDEFLSYDYVGAPWPLPSDDFSYRDFNRNIIRVGNSVSLRSKRLLNLPKLLKMPWEADSGFYNEDGFICVKNRHIFEKNGFRFAPLEIAKFFSHESMIPEIKNIKPFAFHKWMGSNKNYPKFHK
jgi:hypothetical protein